MTPGRVADRTLIDYFSVDQDVVWGVIENDLPTLAEALARMSARVAARAGGVG